MRRAVAFVLFVWALTIASSSAETFHNPYRLALPSTPGLLLHGDLNGDGIDDIVYSETTAPINMHILLGQGGGNYIPGPTFALPAGVSAACRMDDYNGDHHLDLACNYESASQASVVYFAGNGDGTFGAPRYVSLPASNSGYFYLVLIPTGDINGDGVADLFAADEQGRNSYVVLSDGSGGFKVGPPLTYYVPTTFLDLNGDGRLDALDGSFNVALGNGDGSFGTPHQYGTPGSPQACAYGDLDRDGHPDAVCLYPENITGDIVGAWDLLIYHGNPDGTFASTPEYKRVFGDKSNEEEDYGSIGTPTGVGDFNNDGIPDILTNSVDGTTILYGKPGLTFADPVHFASNTYPFESLLSDPISSFIADINGDGLPDFVATGPNGIYFTYAQPNGIYKAAPAYEVTGVIGSTVTEDFDGDGIPDIIASGDNTLAFSKGNGDGTFQQNRRLDTGTVRFSGLYDHALSCPIYRGDFNGDGKQDLLVYGSSDPSGFDPSYYLLLGNGDGTFQPIQQVGLASTTTLSTNLLIRDINGDGRDDIIQPPAQDAGLLTVELSNGDGTFRSASTQLPVELTQNTFPVQDTVPAIADFDHDGKMDLIVGSRDNAYFLRGNGDGTFATPVKIPIPHFASTGDTSMATVAGDFDGDGKPDFAVLWGYPGQNTPIATGSQLFVYYGNGDGTFSTPVLADTSTAGFSFLAAGELNNDGRDELIATTSQDALTPTNVSVYHGLANRSFLPATPYLAGIGLASLNIVDLNRDGFADLVFSNGDYNGHGNSVTILMNEGNTAVVTGTLLATPEPSTVGAPFTLTATLIPPDSTTLSGNVTFTIDGNVVGTTALSADKASLVITNPLAIGSHTLTASWPGNSTYPSVLLLATHTVAGLPTTLTLSQPATQLTVGDIVNITEVLATTAASTINASGSIITTDSAATGSSTNTFSSAPLPATSRYGYTLVASGIHTLTGNYSGDATYAASTGTLSFTVAPLPVTLVLTAAPNPAFAGATVTLTATTQATMCGLCGPVSGSILFYDGATFLGSAILSRTGVATLPVSFSTAGTHTLQATYAGDISRGPATATATEQVVRADTALTLTSSPNPSARGSLVTFTATLTANGKPVTSGSINFFDLLTGIGSVPLNANGVAIFTSSSLTVGTHTITASFPISPAYNVATAILQQIVTQAATQTFLTATPNPLYQHQTLTLASTTMSTAIPAGPVQFFDGTTLLGTLPAANGLATLTTNTLTTGAHTIISAYLGDANTLPSNSAPVTVNVLPSDFTLASTPPALSVQTEHHLTFTLTAQSIGDFADTLKLTTAGLPAHMSVALTPNSPTLTAGARTTVSVYVDTDDVIGFKSALEPTVSTTRLAWLFLASPVLLLLRRKRFKAVRLFATVLLALGAIGLTGCSGLYPASTAPGIYSIEIQAMGTSTGLSHMLEIPVTVTH